jgi:hypothetical protein
MFFIEEITNIDQYNRTIHKDIVSNNSFFSKIDTFGLVESIIREVLFQLILLFSNIYILFKLIQIGRRKKRLNTNSSNVQM